MTDEVYMREGPWIDEKGRPCHGVWADEGGQLLILRREFNGGVTVHAVGPVGREQRKTTISSFRLKRLADFLLEVEATNRAIDEKRGANERQCTGGIGYPPQERCVLSQGHEGDCHL